MFEKNLKQGYLLDFYGDVLSERKREVLSMYYNEDFSLAEIAEEIGISRQGVRDIIKKTEEELLFLEDKLGLAKKFLAAKEHTAKILELSQRYSLPEELTREILSLEETIM